MNGQSTFLLKHITLWNDKTIITQQSYSNHTLGETSIDNFMQHIYFSNARSMSSACKDNRLSSSI